MWKPARSLRSAVRRAVDFLAGFVALTASAGSLHAQGGPIDAPNAMAPHTVFIILITGAFLAWAASFSIHLSRERKGRASQEELARHRDALFDRLAAIELARESGDVDDAEYRVRVRESREELTRVMQRLRATSKARRSKT